MRENCALASRIHIFAILMPHAFLPLLLRSATPFVEAASAGSVVGEADGALFHGAILTAKNPPTTTAIHTIHPMSTGDTIGGGGGGGGAFLRPASTTSVCSASTTRATAFLVYGIGRGDVCVDEIRNLGRDLQNFRC